MPGPIDGLRFAHTALEREIADLERLVVAAAAPADAGALSGRFDALERFCHGHTKGEELGLFPELEAALPSCSATYLFDHEDERAAFSRIREGLAAAGGGDEAALVALRREVVALSDHLRRHIRKENELVLPLVAERFSVPEQAAMVGRIVSVFTPADMATIVPFIVQWLDPGDRIRYVGVLAQVVPAPGFQALAGRIRERLGEAAYASLAAGVPALQA